jgi:hypothetical protein
MSKIANHDGHGPSPRPPFPADNETARAWADLRRTAALVLMFCGAVALFSLALDQVLPAQRPTRPLVALTLGPALLAAGYLMDRGALGSLLGRRAKAPAPGAEPSATPEPGAVPDPYTAGDLWVVIIGPPLFVGLFVCLPLVATPREGSAWNGSWEILGGITFLGLWATTTSSRLLRELVRRREWVPPGTARHPILVAIALTALLAAAVVAVMHTLVWVERLSGLAK